MCREIIEAHHGRIRVDSSVGKGTAFTIKLPAASKAAPKHPPTMLGMVPAAPLQPNLSLGGQPPVQTG
jgi:hypothetical protein